MEVLETRRSISQDKKNESDTNEGIYVRDKKTGEVNLIKDLTYMLNEHEELYEKELS